MRFGPALLPACATPLRIAASRGKPADLEREPYPTIMRIGIDTLPLVQSMHGGAGPYIRHLITGLQEIDRQNEYWIFTSSWSSKEFQLTAPNFHEVNFSFNQENRLIRVLVEQVRIPQYARKLELTVVHSPIYVAPLRLPCASVVTIHDLQAFYPELTRTWRWAQYYYYRLLIPPSLRRASRIIAISDFTAQDLVDKLHVPPGRIATIHRGVDQELFRSDLDASRDAEIRARYELDKDYLLCVGGYAPHKNLDTVAKAMEILRRERGVDMQLVVIGLQTDFFRHWRSRLPAGPLNAGRYRFPGHVPTGDLPYLYKMARCLVCASLFEGFGLPLLEAFACGCPVISSNTTALPEVAGGAALLIDPLDARAIASAIHELCTNGTLRSQLIQKSLARARGCTWRREAAATLATYEAAAEAGRGGARNRSS